MAVRAVITIVSPLASVTLDPLARNPVALDAVGLGDVFARVVAYQRGYGDASGAADTVTRAVVKALSDASGTGDQALKAVGKDVADASTVSDAEILAVAKPVSDGGMAGDQALKAAGKAAADTSTIGDVLARTVNYSRAPIDSAGVADSTVESFGKALSRTASATDSGVMALPAGYAANYFALDYVNPVCTW